jgi:hypothetical protein
MLMEVGGPLEAEFDLLVWKGSLKVELHELMI